MKKAEVKIGGKYYANVSGGAMRDSDRCRASTRVDGMQPTLQPARRSSLKAPSDCRVKWVRARPSQSHK